MPCQAQRGLFHLPPQRLSFCRVPQEMVSSQSILLQEMASSHWHWEKSSRAFKAVKFRVRGRGEEWLADVFLSATSLGNDPSASMWPYISSWDLCLRIRRTRALNFRSAGCVQDLTAQVKLLPHCSLTAWCCTVCQNWGWSARSSVSERRWTLQDCRFASLLFPFLMRLDCFGSLLNPNT